MTFTDYLIDSLLVLLVLQQIKPTTLTNRLLIRPLVIVAGAVAGYLHGIPTAGNDLALIAALGLLGATLGIASGRATIMHTLNDGTITVRAGWSAAILWVCGMGARFGFIWWITHTGTTTIAHFSAAHAITSSQAWTVALLAMAVSEVLGRTLVLTARRHHLQQNPAAALA